MLTYERYQIALTRYITVFTLNKITGDRFKAYEDSSLEIIRKYSKELRKDRYFIEE